MWNRFLCCFFLRWKVLVNMFNGIGVKSYELLNLLFYLAINLFCFPARNFLVYLCCRYNHSETGKKSNQLYNWAKNHLVLRTRTVPENTSTQNLLIRSLPQEIFPSPIKDSKAGKIRWWRLSLPQIWSHIWASDGFCPIEVQLLTIFFPLSK